MQLMRPMENVHEVYNTTEEKLFQCIKLRGLEKIKSTETSSAKTLFSKHLQLVAVSV